MHSLWRQTHQNSSSCKDNALFFRLVRMYSEIEKRKDLFFFFRNMQNRKCHLFRGFLQEKNTGLCFGAGENNWILSGTHPKPWILCSVHSPKLKTKAGGKSSRPGSYCNRAPASAFLTSNKQLAPTVMVDNYIVPAQQTRCSAELHKCALCLLHH